MSYEVTLQRKDISITDKGGKIDEEAAARKKPNTMANRSIVFMERERRNGQTLNYAPSSKQEKQELDGGDNGQTYEEVKQHSLMKKLAAKSAIHSRE